jgi:hypothetical protein
MHKVAVVIFYTFGILSYAFSAMVLIKVAPF